MHNSSRAFNVATPEQDFIATARLAMILGLVYHHLFEIPGSGHSPRLALAGVEHFVPEFLNSFTHMTFMAAVPLLSTISGYLFFHRPVIDYGVLLRKRLHSVALPAWLWAALWLAVGYGFWLVGADHGLGRTGYDFAEAGPMTLVNGIFGLTREPFALQFWFVRDLLLVLLLTPLLYWLLLRLGWYLLAMGTFMWVLVPSPPLFFAGTVPLFFAVGAWLSLPDSPRLVQVLSSLRQWRWYLVCAFSAVLLARLFSHTAGNLQTLLAGHAWLCLLRVLGVLTVSALLYRPTSGPGLVRTLVERFAGYSFFVFALHYPLIELVQTPVLLLPGQGTAVGLTLTWLLVPFLTIVLCLWLASSCEHNLPKLFSLLNGGRPGTIPACNVTQQWRAAA